MTVNVEQGGQRPWNVTITSVSSAVVQLMRWTTSRRSGKADPNLTWIISSHCVTTVMSQKRTKTGEKSRYKITFTAVNRA